MADVEHSETDIAVIGMAGRFPGADTIEAFWKNLRDGLDSFEILDDEKFLVAWSCLNCGLIRTTEPM